jgi:hypothetical protein
MLLPKWDIHFQEPAFDGSPDFGFVKEYSAGRNPIKIINKRFDVATEDPLWLKDACQAVLKLSRYELCTLYAYSAQIYGIITGFLRHKGRSKFNTTMVYDESREWRWGQHFLHANPSLYLKKDVDQTMFTAFLNAKKERNWSLLLKIYKKLRPSFTDAFLRACRTRALESNDGMLLFPQAARIYSLTSVAAFKRIIPDLTNDAWIQVLKMFVSDIDSIFDKMPPTRSAMTVFRGVKNMKEIPTDPSFASTTLDKATAKRFASKKCCVHEIEIPIGTKLIPLIPVGQYEEQEILLPRNFN